MNLSPKIQKALNVASVQHEGQKRKAGGLPYITHPFSVAIILSSFTDDEDILCAGLLHDVLEDTIGYSYDDMKRDFGVRVADCVKNVSEDKDPRVKSDEKENWQERKEKYLIQLGNADEVAIFVSVADKIHNLSSMIEAYKLEGEKLWERFNSPASKKYWFYEEVYKIASRKLQSPIVGLLKEKLEELKGVSL
jgi:(p)ppGpp synthase/HD superfamily hydrolase